MTNSLQGKVAVVTGSGQGVGRGIAIVLAREGAKVVTNNRKPRSAAESKESYSLDEAEMAKLGALPGDAESTANEITRAGGEAVPFYGNVADYETAGKLIQAAIDAFGRIDILVNNAAGLGSGALAATTEADFDYVMASKVKGAFNCMHHAVPFMVQQKFGRVVNVSSDAWVGLAGLAAYGAANSGVVGLSKAAAKELYPAGVTVNVICPMGMSPGFLLEFTEMKRKFIEGGIAIPESKLKELMDAHGPAENMAPFVAYLATEEAAFISGAVFSVRPGRVALYSDPAPTAVIEKSDSLWTVEELIKVAPGELLKDYVPIATRSEWGSPGRPGSGT